jgi:hypothetical protein
VNETSPNVNRACLAGAAAASAGAGLVHAAAAGTHAGHGSLAVLFAVCAVAQVGWAALAALRPSRPAAVAGVALNGAALAAWALSRTTGLPVIDALREAEDAGTQDLIAALLALAAVLGAAAALVVPRRLALPPVLAALVVAALVVPAVPAMAAGHSHSGDAAHSGAAGHDGDAGHEHGSADAAGSGHEHHDVPGRLDHEPTDDQREAARELIDETAAATTGYADVNAATAAGYRSIGDGAGGYEHFVNPAFMADGAVLDPQRPESLVYEVGAGGARRFTTVMYTLRPGSTMDDVPDIAGNLTVWHTHEDLCFAPGTVRLSGVVVDGACRPGGVNRPSAPMLHVWVVANDCGPFAGTDRRQATGSCVGDGAL